MQPRCLRHSHAAAQRLARPALRYTHVAPVPGRTRHRTLPHAQSGAAAGSAGDGDSEKNIPWDRPITPPPRFQLRGPGAIVEWGKDKIDEFWILARSPSAANQLETKWARARRTKRRIAQQRKSAWKYTKRYQAIQAVKKFIWDLLFPVRWVWNYFHWQIFRVIRHYNQFVSDEHLRSWTWKNEFYNENVFGRYVWSLFKSVLYWFLYYALTPSGRLWVFILPFCYGLLAAYDWGDYFRRGGTYMMIFAFFGKIDVFWWYK